MSTPLIATDRSRSLLLQLIPDYKGKQTCRECLRSKANPSPAVVATLQHEDWLAAPSLLRAQEILISEHLPLLKTNVSSSIEGFTRLGTVFQFLQLLLVQTDKLPPEQVSQIAARLIQCMTKEITSIPIVETQQEDEMDLLTSDASTSLDRRQLICFAIQCLLRLNHYAKIQIGLIAPLWRGICDLHKLSDLSQEMLEGTVQPLMGMLQDGYPRIRNSLVSDGANPHEASFAIQGKLISFLTMRLATLLAPTNVSIKVRSKAYKVMLSLQGLAHVADENAKLKQSSINPSMKNTCEAIASKVEKLVIASIISTDHTIHRTALDCLLRVTLSSSDQNNDITYVHRLSYNAFSVTKAGLLVALLRHATVKDLTNASNADALLAICEFLHSMALPQCYSTLTLACRRQDSELVNRLVADSIRILASTILRIEESLESSPSKVQRPQLHRLLVRWMAPNRGADMHPISRETIISLGYLYLAGSQNSSQRAFLTLLVKVFFDPRSHIGLRRNLSSLLVMILTSESKLRDLARQIVENEAEITLWNEEAKKRKRSPGVSSCKQYEFDDLQEISRVLMHLRASSGGLMKAIQSFCQQIVKGGSFSRKEDIHTPRLAKAEYSCLMLALMQGTLFVNPLSRGSFSAKTGASLLEFHQALIQSITVLPTQQNEASTRRHASLCSSILQFCNKVCMSVQREVAADAVPVEDLCDLLSFCTKMPFLPSISAVGKEKGKNHRCRSTVLFDAIGLLGSIGNAIPQTCPQHILQTVKDVFSKLLSLNDWAVASQVVSSLVSFGQKLHQAHQHVLPGCLPRHRQELFRNRMGANRGIAVSSKKEGQDLIAFNSSKVLLGSLCQMRDFGKSIFPSASTLEVVQGSYFLQMSTQEGRQALVIFPPGSQSIKDIKYMKGLESDDEMDDETKTLKRATLSGSGGCKFLLKPYS